MSDTPLRIALVTVEYPPEPSSYGLGTYTQTLASALAERGHSVHVLARSAQGDALERQGKLTVERLGPGRPQIGARPNLTRLAKLGSGILRNEWRYRKKLALRLEELARGGLDLIEAPDATAEALFYDPKKHPEIPLVVKLHGPFAVAERYDKNVPESVRRLILAFERRQLLKATHLTVPSGTVVELFRREFGLQKPLTVLPNPPSRRLFPAASAAPRNPNLVLFAGRIAPMKGVDLLIEAIPAVLERFPETRFVIAGGDALAEDRFEASRDALYQRLPPQFRHALTFTGRLPYPELSAYYQRAAVCVLPSRYETFGYTCLEAMSFGNAVVGGKNGGMRELLDGGRAGLVVEAEAQQVAGAVVQLLGDPALRRTLGQRARLRSETVFGEKAVLDATEAFYRQAIGGGASRGLSQRERVR